MGSCQSKKSSNLTESMHYDYSKLTFLDIAQVHVLHSQWRACAPDVIDANAMAKLPFKTVMKIEQLRCNPFGDKLVHHFSPYKDGSMTFDDFINMYSLLSEYGTKEFKIFLMFQIFDDDSDGYLSCSDCIKIIKRLLKHEYMQNVEIIICLQWLLREADIDETGRVSFDEFQHVMHKSINFHRNWGLI